VRQSWPSALEREKIFDCVIAIIIGGLIGGRLLFVVINWEYYRYNLTRIFVLNEGGLAFQGALAAAFIVGIIAARIKGISFWKGADLFAPYIALGQSIGRIGCFLNGCCYGLVTNDFFGVTFPGEAFMRIPVQIYSSVCLFFVALFLIFIRKKCSFKGCLFCMYLIMYSIFRFFIDFLRIDTPPVFLGLHLAQLISIGTLVFGIALLLILRKRSRRFSGSPPSRG